ncbi:MAG: hypothetical protein Q8R37_00975 [Nanoarchaeota archaeon]|nr:hypothetical protein [Nanoarchaeota archaeon]
MEAIPKLALYILAIVIFIILFSFFFGSNSGFNAVKKVFSGVKESVNVSIGASQVKGEKPVLPAEQKEAINLLKRTMEKMKGKQQCFQKYQTTGGGSDQGRNGLPRNGLPLLGEEGTSIILEKAGNDLRMILLGGVAGKQEISRDIIPGINPCVISGENIPARFQSQFIEKLGPVSDYYNAIDKVMIIFDGSENKISYNDGPLLDFEDGGFLYTPDGAQVCFFPTNDASTNDDGLDDDFLGNADPAGQFSITALLQKGELKWCQ